MKRFTMFTVVAAIITSGIAYGAEPHQEWMHFLKGKWKYEHSVIGGESGPLKGEVTYRMAAKRTAVVGRGSDNEGDWVELIGWLPDTKSMVFNGHGSPGNYWNAVYKDVSENRLAGKVTGVLPDGKPGNGKVVLERVSENAFEGHITLDADSGNVKDVLRMTRIADEKDN